MSNIILFKNNVVEIIDNYIIMQNNKNAKFNKLFLKNNNLYSYNEEFLYSILLDKSEANIIFQYLQQIGKNEYEFERKKNESISEILKIKINESFENINKKGDLYLKILLSIGAIISILIWWFYGCFNIV